MGSCVPKSQISPSKRPGAEFIMTNYLLKKSSYLDPLTRKKIFDKKDGIAPVVSFQKSKLYLRRKLQVVPQ